MTTMEERLSRLEGGYEHVATKADVAEIKSELNAAIAQVDAKLTAAIADNKAELTATLAETKSEA